MRRVLALGFCLLSATPSLAAPGDWMPDPATVVRLEKAIRIPAPPGHAPAPLAGYARYYAGVTIDGHRQLRGELVALGIDKKQDGIHLLGEASFPRIMDGGCSVVNLVYDVAAARIVSIYCNGYA